MIGNLDILIVGQVTYWNLAFPIRRCSLMISILETASGSSNGGRPGPIYVSYPQLCLDFCLFFYFRLLCKDRGSNEPWKIISDID